MAEQLANYEILLGVSGGIAAYKAVELCSELVKAGAAVTVVMTENAKRFVGPLTFSAICRRRIFCDLFEAEDIYDTQHISLTERADLIVVAPATANIIAKMANGICDDLLSTLLCSADSDILLAPAMNTRMWNNPATKRNIETLADRQCHMIGPETGRLACGTEGIGRMSETADIFERITKILTEKPPKQR